MSTAMDDIHRQAWDRICWVVAGSASAEDRALVEAHLVDCADCRAEYELQQRIRRGMHLDAGPAPDPAPALRRLWARIDASAGPTEFADASLQTPRRPSEVRKWRWPNWQQTFAAAMVVQAVGLAGIVAALWIPQATAPYETLSRSDESAATSVIRYVPAPDMDLAQLQALLARHGLVVVEVSADGAAFGLAPRTASSPGGAAAAPTNVLVDRLRAEPGTLLAEPIGASSMTSARGSRAGDVARP